MNGRLGLGEFVTSCVPSPEVPGLWIATFRTATQCLERHTLTEDEGLAWLAARVYEWLGGQSPDVVVPGPQVPWLALRLPAIPPVEDTAAACIVAAATHVAHEVMAAVRDDAVKADADLGDAVERAIAALDSITAFLGVRVTPLPARPAQAGATTNPFPPSGAGVAPADGGEAS